MAVLVANCQLKRKRIVVSVSGKYCSLTTGEREKGLLTEHYRICVKVAVSDDPNRMDGKEFIKWTDKPLLHLHGMEQTFRRVLEQKWFKLHRGRNEEHPHH